MNTQIYQTIIKTINSNCKLARDDVYVIINKDLKNNKEYLEEIKENRPSNESDENDLINVDEYNNLMKEDESLALIKYQTFISIYSNLKRRQMFKTSMWRKLKENALDFSNQYKEMRSKQIDLKQYKSANERLIDNIILKMANQHNLAPILMVRLILEGYLKTNSIELIENTNNNENENNEKKKEKITISQIIRETHLLKDGRLACEIIECCAIDDDYGPIIDSIKNLSGFKYEKKLENILIEKNIAFIKESELREKGFDKTPDFKFEVPIALKNGIIISWVDSKCSFGDEVTHAEYYETQFKFYLNRFGSGLVIYWLGFVKEIEKSFTSISDRSVVVCDRFPDDFSVFDLTNLIDSNN